MESSIIWVNKEKGGSCNGVIGSSGSGKSTLLHTIAGVDVPTNGKILLEGQDVYAQNNEKLAIFRRRQVGTELNGSLNPDKPYLFVAGYSKEAFEMLPTTLYSGRMPENSGEVLVSAKAAADGGVKFKAGDTITLVMGERIYEGKTLTQSDPYNESEEFVPKGEKIYTVVGICQSPVFEESDAAGYSLITSVNTVENVDSCTLFVTMGNPNRLHTYIDKAAKNHEYLMQIPFH